MVREVGKPLTESVMEHGRAVRILRYQAQSALDPDGDTYPAAPPADMRTLLLQPPPPARRRGADHALELPVRDPAVEGGAGARLRQRGRAQARVATRSRCALLLQEILGEHLPEGVFNVVTGPGAAGQAVVELADVVSFTGSTAVGLGVAAGATARGIASQAEMGGLNASIVLPDADVESAAKVIAGAAMGYAGQKCTATGRVIVLGDPAAVHRRAGRRGRGAAGRRPGRRQHGRRPGHQPAGARRARRRRPSGAPGDGGRVVTGGKALDGPGLFFSPTVVDGQEPTARLAQEEVFGPIVTVLRAEHRRAGGRDLQRRRLRPRDVGLHHATWTPR